MVSAQTQSRNPLTIRIGSKNTKTAFPVHLLTIQTTFIFLVASLHALHIELFKEDIVIGHIKSQGFYFQIV